MGGYLLQVLIVVFGTVCLDRTRWISHLPRAGGYVEIERETTTLGGEASNTAVALRRWGSEVWLCGNELGDGPDADLIRRALTEKDLVWHAIGDRKAPGETPVCDIYVTPDGDRTMFGKGFAAMEPKLIPALVPFAKGVWFTAEPNMPTVARLAVKLATEAGMQIYSMDFIREDDEIPPRSFWQSSTDWAGRRGETFANIEWVRRWAERHGCFTILTDGPNGFIAGSPDVPVRAYPAFPAPEVLNSTGAGDVFRAGMLFGLSQAWPIGRTLQFAAAAGCLKCRLRSSEPDPTREQIEELIAANPDVAKQFLASY